MRIALVATGGFDRSGRERVIPALVWLVERLAVHHDVVVYVLRYHEQPTRYELRGATVHDLGRPQGFRRQWQSLAQAMRSDAPFDVVHGYWGHPAGLLAALVGRRLGIPSVVTCDSGEFAHVPAINYGLQGRLSSRFAVRAATRLATRVTVCSQFQADLARRCGIEPSVIPLGVDRSLFPRTPRPTGAPPWRLLHVASLNPVKDQTTLLTALARLVERGLDVTLDLVGEDTMQGRLQALATTLGITERVRLRGFVPSDALSRLHQQAHLFVLSSHHEAAGVVLLEAAASGLPVLGTHVGYLADWHALGVPTVPLGNALALADAIASHLLDPSPLHRAMGAVTDWARAHDADWSAEAMAALYAEVGGQRTGESRLEVRG